MASIIGGSIIIQEKGGCLLHVNIVGYVSMGIMLVCALFMTLISRQIAHRNGQPAVRAEALPAIEF